MSYETTDRDTIGATVQAGRQQPAVSQQLVTRRVAPATCERARYSMHQELPRFPCASPATGYGRHPASPAHRSILSRAARTNRYRVASATRSPHADLSFARADPWLCTCSPGDGCPHPITSARSNSTRFWTWPRWKRWYRGSLLHAGQRGRTSRECSGGDRLRDRDRSAAAGDSSGDSVALRSIDPSSRSLSVDLGSLGGGLVSRDVLPLPLGAAGVDRKGDRGDVAGLLGGQEQ